MKRAWIIAIVIGLIVSSGACATPPSGHPRQAPANDQHEQITASGFIEAEEIDIAPQLGGRLTELLVEEGDDVAKGQVVARLDGTLLAAQIEAARADLELAQAERAQVAAGTRTEKIRQAEAQLAQAEAARDGAYQSWQDLLAIRESPYDLDAQIAQARAEFAAAEAALEEAVALKDAATIALDNYEEAKERLEEARERIKEIPEPQRPNLPGLQLNFHLIPNEYWKAWVGVNSAGARRDGALAKLQNLLAMRKNPQELNAQIDSARARYETQKAMVRRASTHLEALQAGATAEELAVAEAHVQQAQAALDTLLAQEEKLTLEAPSGGIVLEHVLRAGELAAPGTTLLTLGDLDRVTLTVYVPEDQLGQIAIGQTVEVTVDTFPDRTFEGTLVAIADEAEFTPRNIQTEEERVNMVFAVEVEIPNPEHALKPGLPADAAIITEGE